MWNEYFFNTLYKKSLLIFFFSLAFKLLNDSQERRLARCVVKNNIRQGLYMRGPDNTGINVRQCKFQLVGKLLFNFSLIHSRFSCAALNICLITYLF